MTTRTLRRFESQLVTVLIVVSIGCVIRGLPDTSGSPTEFQARRTANAPEQRLDASAHGPRDRRTVTVPMTLADIAAGTLITEHHLGPGPVLIEALRSQPDVMLTMRVIINRVAKVNIKAAMPIRSQYLEAPQSHVPPNAPGWNWKNEFQADGCWN